MSSVANKILIAAVEADRPVSVVFYRHPVLLSLTSSFLANKAADFCALDV